VSKQPAGDDSVGRMQFMLTLRRRGIGDAAVLRAMDEVPREYFVEGQFLDAAYVVAYMTEQLGVHPRHRVLEIGTGSGYQAAVLSRLAREVVTIERYRTLAEAARARLETLGYRNVEIRLGDGLAGAPDRAPFDRIVITAATETVPQSLIAQLAAEGVMVLPLGPHGGAQNLVRLTKSEDGTAQEELIAVRFVPLLPGQAREL
jgi:protein-L-isoaspartate(D-aspartate) O-methyltransferase